MTDRDSLYLVLCFYPPRGSDYEHMHYFESREHAVEYANAAPPGTLVDVVALPLVLRREVPPVEPPASVWRRAHAATMRVMRRAVSVRGWRCGAT